MKQITGGATAAKGFQAACTAAGIKYENRTDMAMIYSQVPCRVGKECRSRWSPDH